MKKLMRYGIAPWIALIFLILVVLFGDQLDRLYPLDGCSFSERAVMDRPGHVTCEPR